MLPLLPTEAAVTADLLLAAAAVEEVEELEVVVGVMDDCEGFNEDDGAEEVTEDVIDPVIGIGKKSSDLFLESSPKSNQPLSNVFIFGGRHSSIVMH